MTFLETPRFPDTISYGSRGGPVYNTTVIQIDSGYEKRNINWAYPLHQFDVAYGVRDQEDLYELLEYFHVTAGRAYPFRFKDWQDFKSCVDQMNSGITSYLDQTIGTGNASTLVFYLKKTYTKGALSRERLITKPVSATVSIAIGGNEKTVTSEWSCSYASGKITFVSAPADGSTITAGFQFDVPCRFESDVFAVNWEHHELQSTQILVSEIRL